MMEHRFMTSKITPRRQGETFNCQSASAGFASVMTLRTPRRRISPRAKRRYRAIKDFLRRALGSSSQPDIKINSSIAINVSDLKHKIVGIEQQLTEVNKHCRELVCLESSSRPESQTLVPAVDRPNLSSVKEDTDISSTKKVHVHGYDTKLLYKTSESHYRKSDDSDSIKVYHDIHDTKRKDARPLHDMAARDYVKEKKIRKKKSKLDNRLNGQDGSYPNLRKHKARSTYEHFTPSNEATISYHSLNEPRKNRRRCTEYPVCHHEEQYAEHHHYVEPTPKEVRVKKKSRRNSPVRFQEQHEGGHRRKNKRNSTRELNEDFISDIIKRQYRPTRMFGQRESEISQFSAPVCRDQEYPLRENILEASDLCSCCFDGRRKSRYEYEHDLSDMRSICDTRLYSTNRHMRHRHRLKLANYNDSNQYDLVPVKEKSSPKARRRFTAAEMTPYEYKEVPPSPRTHRPRLNIRAQYYTELENYMLQRKNRNGSPQRPRKHFEHSNNNESSDIACANKELGKHVVVRKIQNKDQLQQDVATMSSLQSPHYTNDPANITHDSALNKTQETDSIDKTDKALNEIKDILQRFLQEIKKETSVSQCDNSEINNKIGGKCLNEFQQETPKLDTSVMANSGHSVNNYSVPQGSFPSPFMQAFPNPCCYPILPVCPIPNCMPTSYMMPSQSFTCASCANNVREDYHKRPSETEESTSNVKNSNETDQLIKEIYKYVAQSPNSARRREFHDNAGNEKSRERRCKLTSRSVGGSSKMSRRDAQVETQKIKCQSKSCEAFGSKFLSDTTYNCRTNSSYSDTVLERLSLEAATGSDSEYSSSESTTAKKGKSNKFARVLRSFGLFKKKKDVIEELSESESTVEVKVNSKRPPFKQEVMDYMIHEQEFFNRPSPRVPYELQAPEYRHGYGCHAGCPDHLNHVNPMLNQYHHCPTLKMEHQHCQPCLSPHRPSAPPYSNPYEGRAQNQPQVPLCLKEIEVKSIGTQSERKMTLFKKFTKKMQSPSYPVARKADIQNCSTQTAKDKPQIFNWKAQLEKAKQQAGQTGKDKPGLWSWKTLQAKVNQLDDPNAMDYSYKTQKQLAQGDIKMRNAMLKKMFYKRNPFSPRNLIVRTLLGKDKSSYGEPPTMYKPRMFF